MWWIPLLQVVALQLRFAGFTADEEIMIKDAAFENTHKYSTLVVESFRSIFRIMVQYRMDPVNTKAYGSLFMVVQIIKVYFRMKSMQLCGKIIALFHGAFPDLTVFPKSQTVAYSYYRGRFLIANGKYREAAESLEFAFAHCHKDSNHNLKMILEHLVCVKLYLGYSPVPEFAVFPSIQALYDIARTARDGNLFHFDILMEKHRVYFIQKGLFLILEQLKKFLYRNIFRRTLILNKEFDNITKEHHVTLDKLRAAIDVSSNGYPYDFEDSGYDPTRIRTPRVECIIANLIYEGFIKAYISHDNLVVFSTKDPFPKISEVMHGRGPHAQ